MNAAIVARLVSCRWTRPVVLVLSVCSVAALAWSVFMPTAVRVVYNASDSVPVGWYRITPLDSVSDTEPDSIPVGSIVLTRLPPRAAALANQRGYLPLQVPLLKRVGAIAPQHVCIAGGTVRIDGEPVATVLRTDALGRPLPSWQPCRQLIGGELFLLSVTNPASFDSRYFGPVSRESVIGMAQPIHLEAQP
tara:strand:+ start:1862 stop:2437 length:576 start_codon:yes stop_codon:yes gene_type:complete